MNGLADAEVAVGIGGDLGEVRYAEGLRAPPDRPEFAGDHLASPPADARVDFVEDERGDAGGGMERGVQREHHAGGLAAGGGLGEGKQRFAGVGAEEERNAVDAVGGEGVACSVRGGDAVGVRFVVDADGELGACEADLGEFTGDGLGEVQGRGGAGLGEAPCEVACLG